MLLRPRWWPAPNLGGASAPLFHMELVAFSVVDKHDGLRRCSLTVKGSGEEVTKTMLLRVPDRSFVNRYNLVKRLTEADRDIAFEAHGKDWAKHCPYKTGESPDVQRIALDIANRHPDLF